MGKRTSRLDFDPLDDALLFSDMDDDGGYDEFLHAMEHDTARRRQRRSRRARNRFDDYEEDRRLKRLSCDIDSWQDWDYDSD